MPLEKFFDFYSPGPQLPKLVESMRDRSGSLESPTNFLYSALIKEACAEQREISDKLISEGNLTMTPETGVEILKATIPQTTAIIVGHLLMELSDTALTSQFDFKTFIGNLNFSLQGTGAPHIEHPEWLDTNIHHCTDEEKKSISLGFSQDKSGSIFLREPARLPENVRKHLTSLGLFQSPYVLPIASKLKELIDSLEGKEKPEDKTVTRSLVKSSSNEEMPISLRRELTVFLDSLDEFV